MTGTFKTLRPNASFIHFPEDLADEYIELRCDLYLKRDLTEQQIKADELNTIKESSGMLCHTPDETRVIEIV